MSRDRKVVEKVLESLKNIGQFELFALRESEYGASFRATDPGRRIAVNIRTDWPADYPDAEEYKQQLLIHARAAQSVDHANFAKLIGCGELDDACFTVSTFVEGTTLRSNLWNGEHLNVWDLIDFARQSCTGLEFSHSRGVVHHALHPGNVVFLFDGSTKILDLGLFRGNRPYVDPFHFSAQYLSPEQVAGHGADRFTNLYSVAIMLYEIACGKQPFTGNSWSELEASWSQELAEPIQVKPSVPPGINAAIMKALSRDRSARFQTGPELVNALEEYKEFGKPISVPPPPRPTPKVVPISAAATAPAQVRNPYATVPDLAPPQEISKPEFVSALEPQPIRVKPGFESPPHFESVGPEHLGLDEFVEEPAQPPKPSFWEQQAELAKVAAKQAATATWRYTRKELRRVDPWVLALAILIIILGSFISRTLINSYMGSAEDYKYQQPIPISPPMPHPAPQPAQQLAQPTAASAEAPVVAAPAKTEHKAPAPTRKPQPAPGPALYSSAHPLPPDGTSFNTSTGSVMITTIPAGARVVVDGKPGLTFNTPQLVPSLPTGVHTLTISKDGYASVTRPVQITAGAESRLTVQLDLPSGYLTVMSSPSTAYIVIDGVSTGHVTPSQVPVPPGTHTLTLRKMGYLEASDTFTLKSGEQQTRNVTLLEAGSTPDIRVVAPAGSHKPFASKVNGVRVTVHTTPAGASVFINGQAVGKATPVDVGLNPGHYTMEVRLDGYQTLRKTITVEDGKPLNLDEALQR